jgi:hypothetical protein
MTKPSADKLEEIKKNAQDVVSRYQARNALLLRYREIYFMSNVETPKNPQVDQKDWKITASPSGRNEVVGMQRLLNTSEIHINTDDNDEKADEGPIEKGLQQVMKVSSEGRRGRILSDAALSAVLYGSVTLYAEGIDDLLTVKDLTPFKKAHLEKQRLRSPFLIKIISTEESYPDWDEDMLISHVWKYVVRGSALKARWGVTEGITNETEYTIWDVFNDEFHVVWAEGLKEDLFADSHALTCLPIFCAHAGGSDLFHKPEEQMQSFLYAKAKGELDKRENSILTALFTSIHRRGLLGAMYWIDPDNAPDTITVDYQQGIMFAKGKVTAVNDKIIDPIIFEVQRLLNDMSGESTIHGAALGENQGAGMPFSSLSMMANSGKLPLVDPQRALEQVFTDAFNYILYRIQTDSIKNEQIPPQQITEGMQVKVSLSAKLPQDQLRNAQVAQGLGGLVSDQWKQDELLQIADHEAMQKQIYKERLLEAKFEALITSPQFVQQSVAEFLGAPPADPNAPPVDPNAPPVDPNAMPPQQGQPTPEQMMQQPPMPPGMQPGQPGLEAMPQTGPMIPAQERM